MRPLLARLNRMLAQPSRKLAVLGLVAALMVATPVAQLWREHGAELEALREARSALRPIQAAIAAQRALIQHRPVAAAVLRGLHEQEPARRQRQAEVDRLLAVLANTLDERRHFRALDEAHSMQDGWHQLVRGILERRLAPAASDTAHELLLEQAMVIVDLESMLAGAGRASAEAAILAAVASSARLETAAARWLATEEGTEVQARAMASARLQLQLGLARRAAASLPPPELFDPATRRSLLGLQAAVRAVDPRSAPALGLVQDAERASAAAQVGLMLHAEASMAARLHALERKRNLAGLCGTLGTLLGGGLLVWLGRQRRPPARPTPAPSQAGETAPTPSVAPAPREATQALMQRLQEPARNGRAAPADNADRHDEHR